MKRKPFVCRRGHIFMSLIQMKPRRVRVCPHCLLIVADTEVCQGMKQARAKAPARQRRYGQVFEQVFVKGQIVTREVSQA